MIRNTNPNNAKKAEVTETLAALNRSFSKMRTGSNGCSTRSSQLTNDAMSAAEIANPPNVNGLSHPYSGASMMVKTRALIDVIDKHKPTRSSRGAEASSSLDDHVERFTALIVNGLLHDTSPTRSPRRRR